MTMNEQVRKIKENWLLVLIPFVLLFLVFGGLSSVEDKMSSFGESFDDGVASSRFAPAFASREMSFADGGFAPGVTDRLIAKTARLSTETERGKFDEAIAQLKAIVKTSDAFVVNENVAKSDQDEYAYRTGSFDVKVESGKYDAFIAQLRLIGEVQSFTESADDVTGTHEDVSIQLDAERERLKRYDAMFAEATDVEDKIQLSDRIFNQQSLIKLLENNLRDLDQRVSYSSVSVYVQEKQSSYAGIEFIGLGELVASFVSSLSTLLSFIVAVLPWTVVIWVGMLIRRKLRSRKK